MFSFYFHLKRQQQVNTSRNPFFKGNRPLASRCMANMSLSDMGGVLQLVPPWGYPSWCIQREGTGGSTPADHPRGEGTRAISQNVLDIALQTATEICQSVSLSNLGGGVPRPYPSHTPAGPLGGGAPCLVYPGGYSSWSIQGG